MTGCNTESKKENDFKTQALLTLERSWHRYDNAFKMIFIKAPTE